MHVLFAEGFADWDYLRRHTDCPDELAAHLQDAHAGLGSRDHRLARLRPSSSSHVCMGAASAAYIRCHHGFSRSRNGAANMHAVTCLPAVTGAWQHPGGGALYGHTGIYPLDRTLIEGLDLVDRSVRDLDQSRLGPILTGDADALKGGPPVTALLVQNTNPAMVCPELHKVHAGLAREDLFTCVHEQFMTETAAFADIVLPATTFLEHDDFYTASGHTHVPGDAQGDRSARRGAREPLCDLRAGEAARRAASRLRDERLGDHGCRRCIRSGMWDAQTNYERGGQDFAYPFEKMHFLDGFDTADRKFHFRGDWQRFGGRWQEMPVLPDHLNVIDNATADKPFRLIAAPARTFLNSTFTETPSSVKRERRPTVLIHPEDCAALGVAEGDRVRLGNERGEVIVHVKPHEGQQRGVVVVEGIWPNRHFENGIGINALTSADPGGPTAARCFTTPRCGFAASTEVQRRSGCSGSPWHRSRDNRVKTVVCFS